MKKGTPIGKVDAGYLDIRVGDTVRNIHNKLEGVVNSYGSVERRCGIVEKISSGEDWVVVEKYDPAEELKEKESVMPEMEAMKEAVEELTGTAVEEAAEEKETEAPEQNEGQTIMEAARPSEPAPAPTDQELVNELRARGYTVTATKRIEVITYETIEL